MMDMNLFEKNKKILQVDGNLYSHIIVEPPQFRQISTVWEKECLCIEVAGVRRYCDSCYSRKEEFRWLLQQIDLDTEYLVFMGSVSREAVYYFRYYLKNLSTIIFIEPTNQIIKARLQRENIYEITKSSGKIDVYYFCNEPVDNFVEMICNTAGYGNKFSVIASLSYQALFPEYYQELLAKTVKRMRLLVTNVVTHLISQRQFNRHAMLNYGINTFNASVFREFLRGKPAILVGAGPSLKKNIHLLKNLADKAIIFAGGSSMPTLSKYGIKPHFNVVYEAGDNSKFMNDTFFADVPLLFGSQTNPASLHAYKGSKINLVTDTDDLSLYYFDDRKEAIESGPSVMNIAHDFVCNMGCSPVIFIGQDMCLYGNKLHAIDDKYIHGTEYTYKGDFTTIDIHGQEVETLTGYWVIKTQLEKVNKKYRDIKFINATEGGLGIEGVENDSLENVIRELPEQDYPLVETLAQIIANNMEKSVPRIKTMAVNGFVDDMDKFFSNSRKLLLYAIELETCVSISKQKQLMSRIKYQYKQIQEDSLYQEVVRRVYGEFIKTIEARYKKDLNGNNGEKKIAAFAAQYKTIMKEFMDFCAEMKAAYDIASGNLSDKEGSVQ